MLLHSPAQGNIIGLCKPSQRVEQQDGVLVAHLKKAATGVGHQQCVAIVHGITELEGEHCISIALRELLAQFGRRQPETIKAVVVLDRLQDLEIAANQPVASIGYGFFDVRQARCSGSPSSCNSFFLWVLVDLNADIVEENKWTMLDNKLKPNPRPKTQIPIIFYKHLLYCLPKGLWNIFIQLLPIEL